MCGETKYVRRSRTTRLKASLAWRASSPAGPKLMVSAWAWRGQKFNAMAKRLPLLVPAKYSGQRHVPMCAQRQALPHVALTSRLVLLIIYVCDITTAPSAPKRIWTIAAFLPTVWRSSRLHGPPNPSKKTCSILRLVSSNDDFETGANGSTRCLKKKLAEHQCSEAHPRLSWNAHGQRDCWKPSGNHLDGSAHTSNSSSARKDGTQLRTRRGCHGRCVIFPHLCMFCFRRDCLSVRLSWWLLNTNTLRTVSFVLRFFVFEFFFNSKRVTT